MLNPIVSSIVYAAEMLIIFIFFNRISEKKLPILKSFFIGILLFEFGSFINLVFQNNTWINTFFSILIQCSFALLCFDLSWRSVICYSIKRNKPRSPSIYFFSPLSVATCLILFWYISIQDGVSFKIQYLLSIVSVLIFSSTALLFITYQHQIQQNSEYIHQKSELDRLQTEKSYYDIWEQQNENLMIYAHDAKKHLAAIQSLNHDPEIDNYVNTLSDHLKSYSKNCHSGNKLLDVMIHKHSMDCRTKGISFYYDVRQCNFRNVTDIDLVAILGNLMDNAVTAPSKSVKKEVSLETTNRNSYSVLIINNSCDCAPIAKGNRLLSSKDSSQLHGYGLKSVAKTLENYQGDMRWEYDDARHTFTMTVMIED